MTIIYENHRETPCHFYVDGKDILAHWVDTRHPEMLDFPHGVPEISGATLWGILRHVIVNRFFLTFDGPDRINMVIVITDRWTPRIVWRECYTIRWNGYLEFVEEYCDNPHKMDIIMGRVDWKREGF